MRCPRAEKALLLSILKKSHPLFASGRRYRAEYFPGNSLRKMSDYITGLTEKKRDGRLSFGG